MRGKFTIPFVVVVVMGTVVAAHAQVITNVERLNPTGASSAALVRLAPGPLADGAETYADRTHVYRNVPEVLAGAEYVLTANDDKRNPFHELHLTLGQAGMLYLIIDNRVGTNVRDATISPNLEAAGMTWVTEMGFVDTAMKMALDEHGDGSINNYYSVFSKPVPAGVIVLGAQNDVSFGNSNDRNMYGVAAVADREAGDSGLVGWWKLDGIDSGLAVDFSGWGHHGVLYGRPRWVQGYLGGALQLDGQDDYVDTNWAQDLAQWTVCVWVRSPAAPAAGPASGPVHREANYQLNWNHEDPNFRGAAALCIGDAWYPASFGSLSADTWYHLAATFDGSALQAFCNGTLVTINPAAQGMPASEPASLKFGRHAAGELFFTGAVDDIRLYRRALTQQEIENIMRYDPLLAWNPRPADGTDVGIRDVNDLSWSAGESAAAHDLYLGTDPNAVATADLTSPLYRGRQTVASFPLGGLVQPGERYFWRVDEVEADDTTVHRGIVWTFTVSEYLLIDDFENYTEDEGSRIEETWMDGLINGTGSQVDRWSNLPTAWMEVVPSKWSMLLAYDNTRSPFVSEVEREFAVEQDWTAGAMDTLSLSFEGDVVSFGQTSEDTYIMSAAGSDIWSNNDQFRYAYKRLDGDGAIVARVGYLVQSHAWAKAGVMIRESLDRASAHASMFVTPDGRRAFQNRQRSGSGICLTAHSYSWAVSLPHWVKIERTGNQFTGYHSVDGINWIQQPADEDVVARQSTNPQTIGMAPYVYVGLALTSHAAGVVATAEFSGVEITGDIIGEWQVAEIGVDHPGNSPDDLYVTVEDNDGKTAVVVNPDPAAANATAWTEWEIPLSDFIGVDLSRVRKMNIGVGGRETTVPPGTGRIHIDDIRVRKP